MKARLSILIVMSILLLLAISTHGVTPHLINYQGYLLDGDDLPLTGTIKIDFTIYAQISGDTAIWAETHNSVVVTNGSFDVLLGSQSALLDVVFNDSSRYLGIAINDELELSPRSRLVSVPYSSRVGGLQGAEAGEITGDLVILSDGSSSSITVTDSNGDVRFSLVVGPDDVTSISFYDPVDVKSGGRGTGDKAISIDNTGIVFFGASTADTTIHIDTLGNFRGRGQLAMGPNSSNSGFSANVFGYSNVVTGDSSSITGGKENLVSGFVSTIAGGVSNEIAGDISFIGAGLNNYIDTLANLSAIGGGISDSIFSIHSFIGGGKNNTVSGEFGAILGGRGGKVSGNNSAILGGTGNSVTGDQGVAIGTRAKVNHAGSIMITATGNTATSDSTRSGGVGQMILRADSGIYIMNSGGTAAYSPGRLINVSNGAYLSVGGDWINGSSREIKENMTEVNGSDLLRRLENLSIYNWNYKNEDDDNRHIGPVAEDFHATFGVGADDKSISTIDPSGIALAAIKELIEQNKSLQEKLLQVEQELKKLKDK